MYPLGPSMQEDPRAPESGHMEPAKVATYLSLLTLSVSVLP
jgi:hypothetical protein